MQWPWQTRTPLAAALVSGTITGARLADGQPVGLLQSPDGRHTIMLELEGRRLWLDDPATIEPILAAFAGALAGPPVRLFLRRRRADLAAAQAAWDALVGVKATDPRRQAEFGAGPLARLASAGVARVTAALSVTATSEHEALALASSLLERLPSGSRPFDVRDLHAWWSDCLGHEAGADGQMRVLPPSADREQVWSAAGQATRYWRLEALPASIEVGWVRRLLADPALAHLAWDLALDCLPVEHPEREHAATVEALRSIEHRLARWHREQRPAQHLQARVLAAEHTELRQRLVALEAPDRGLRRLAVWLAARADDDGLLAAATEALGARLRPIRGVSRVVRAWRALGPALSETDAHGLALVLPSTMVAPFAWWAVTPAQAPVHWPALTLTAERTTLRAPSDPADDHHLLTTGADPADGRTLLRHWAAALAWTGYRVIVFGSDPAWADLARAVPADWRALGPDGQLGCDAVATGHHRLERQNEWAVWLEEAAAFVHGLLPEASADERDDLRAALVALGLARLEKGEPLGLRRLHDELDRNGYVRLADQLADVLHGPGAWLSRPTPALPRTPGLTIYGWHGAGHEAWPGAITSLLRRLDREHSRGPADQRLPTLVLVDDGPTLLTNPAAANALIDASRKGQANGLRLWLNGGPTDGLTRSLAGRLLLVNIGERLATGEPLALDRDLVDGAGWSPAAAATIRALPAGAAVLRHAGRNAVVRVAMPTLNTVPRASSPIARSA